MIPLYRQVSRIFSRRMTNLSVAVNLAAHDPERLRVLLEQVKDECDKVLDLIPDPPSVVVESIEVRP